MDNLHTSEFRAFNDNLAASRHPPAALFPLHDHVSQPERWQVPGFVYLTRQKQASTLVNRIGVNDARFYVQYDKNDGGRASHPAWVKWEHMIRRNGSAVCDEWRSFMGFANWYFEQNDHWQGSDGELLVLDANYSAAVEGMPVHYSPTTCLLITERAKNSFTPLFLGGEDVPPRTRRASNGKSWVIQQNRTSFRVPTLEAAQQHYILERAIRISEVIKSQPNENARQVMMRYVSRVCEPFPEAVHNG